MCEHTVRLAAWQRLYANQLLRACGALTAGAGIRNPRYRATYSYRRGCQMSSRPCVRAHSPSGRLAALCIAIKNLFDPHKISVWLVQGCSLKKERKKNGSIKPFYHKHNKTLVMNTNKIMVEIVNMRSYTACNKGNKCNKFFVSTHLA